MIYRISKDAAPALGDVQDAGPGDMVMILRDARERHDMARYWAAAGVAFQRGATITGSGI
ncbi:hypothetical protein ACWCYY_18220 [Kitasatospora sp. NPDC001664]